MTLSPILVTQPRFESFEEYLNYTDNNNRLYELFNGELVQMPPEPGFNIGIANFLNDQLTFEDTLLNLTADRILSAGC